VPAAPGRLPPAALTGHRHRNRHRATAIYSAYLGTTALRRVDAAPADREDYIATLLAGFGVQPTA